MFANTFYLNSRNIIKIIMILECVKNRNGRQPNYGYNFSKKQFQIILPSTLTSNNKVVKK